MPTRRRNKYSSAPRYWPWLLVGLWLLACLLGPRQLHAHTVSAFSAAISGVDDVRLNPSRLPPCVFCR